jgi:hypothetical protein
MIRLLFVATIASPVGTQLYTNDGLVQALEKRAADMELTPGKLEINTTKVCVGIEVNGTGTDVCDWLEFAERELLALGIEIPGPTFIAAIRSNPGGTVDARTVDPINFKIG